MPKLIRSVPKLSHHKATGQAFVKLDGQFIYLGKWKSRIAQAQYDRIVAEWLMCGRQLPQNEADVITVAQIIDAYKKHARCRYGSESSEYGKVKNVTKIVRELYGHEPGSEFGPLALKVVRQRIVETGVVRKTVNSQTQKITRMFKWAAGMEMVPGSVPENLKQVEGLKENEIKTPDPEPRQPVSIEDVMATLPHLPSVVQAMVRVQLYCGCRPTEICIVRPCDIDTSGAVWVYTPQLKLARKRKKGAEIYLGPKAQNAIEPYLDIDPETYCFSPRLAIQERDAKRSRKTPLNQGNRRGYSRRARSGRNAKKSPGDRYSKDSYRRCITEACAKHDIPRWTPHQLRHTRGTEVRHEFGLEAAQHVLGHSHAKVTEIYAHANRELAQEVAAKTG